MAGALQGANADGERLCAQLGRPTTHGRHEGAAQRDRRGPGGDGGREGEEVPEQQRHSVGDAVWQGGVDRREGAEQRGEPHRELAGALDP